jgi:L-ascorbate metabolism protein UlaG (beta-lactamase superfamily)
MSAFRIEAGAAKMLIDPFLSDNPSWDKGWIGFHRVYVHPAVEG